MFDVVNNNSLTPHKLKRAWPSKYQKQKRIPMKKKKETKNMLIYYEIAHRSVRNPEVDP